MLPEHDSSAGRTDAVGWSVPWSMSPARDDDDLDEEKPGVDGEEEGVGGSTFQDGFDDPEALDLEDEDDLDDEDEKADEDEEDDDFDEDFEDELIDLDDEYDDADDDREPRSPGKFDD